MGKHDAVDVDCVAQEADEGHRERSLARIVTAAPSLSSDNLGDNNQRVAMYLTTKVYTRWKISKGYI